MNVLLESLDYHATAAPAGIAIARRKIDGSYEQTPWRSLHAQTLAFAEAFRALPPDQIIPLCLAKSASCVAAMLGALAAGHAFSVLNQKLRPPQIAHILQATGAPLALIDEAGLMAIKGALAEPSPITQTHWLLLRGPNFAPMHQRLADELAAKTKVTEWHGPAHDSGSHGPAQFAGPCSASTAQTACCLFTSGSTGTPKGVLISAADLHARAAAEVDWYNLTFADILLSILPFSFDVGLNQLLTCVLTGCQLVILDSWLPRDILKTAAERRVTGISSVPSIWLDFLTHNLAFDPAVHASLRYITLSGGDMSPHHLAKLPSIAPHAGIYKTYGQTEAFRATSLKPNEFALHPGSVGRPFAGVNVYIVRPDGTLAAPNEPGEVVHTGLGTMLGYLGTQQTDKLRPNPFLSAADSNPMAIFTGDTGYLNDAGYLFLAGRSDDMLKIQGNRVYPSEIRDLLLSIEGIAQAEIVPLKSADQTQLAAFLILRPGATHTSAAIRIALAARAPSYMVPDTIIVKDSFPRTASGKPDRQALAAEIEKRVNEPQMGHRFTLIE